MRLGFITILLTLTFGLIAQSNAFILVKKKDKTVMSLYSGSHFQFETIEGYYKDGVITRIYNDSIYMEEYNIQQMSTRLGFYILDTLATYYSVCHYQSIKRIGIKKSSGFDLQTSGAALFGGGILLTLASGVVYLVDREKFSPALFTASIGLAAVGYFLMKSSGKGIVIGKKNYRLQYMAAGNQ